MPCPICGFIEAIDIDILPYDCLWYGEPNAVANTIGYAMHYSRSHDAVIRVHDAPGNVIETHEHAISADRHNIRAWVGLK